MFGIWHEEISVLPPPKDPSIGANNQLALSISTGIVLAPKMCMLPLVQEIITDAVSDNTGKTGLRGELAGLALMELPHFTVDLVELLPHIPVELVEPGLVELLPQLQLE